MCVFLQVHGPLRECSRAGASGVLCGGGGITKPKLERRRFTWVMMKKKLRSRCLRGRLWQPRQVHLGLPNAHR